MICASKSQTLLEAHIFYTDSSDLVLLFLNLYFINPINES